MSAYDPTDELVRAMLARRADGPPPPWLLGSVVGRVPTTRQVRRGWGLRLPERTWPRMMLAAAALLLLALLAGGILAAGGLLDRWGSPAPTQPAVVVVPSASSPASAEPGAFPSDEPAEPTGRPAHTPETLAPDTLAVVTKKGFDLRVRSAPGRGRDSEEYEPLLQPGTRMLVLRGPVAADGYDWYEVILDDEPGFGWVAAGEDGVPWIRPVAPRCPGALDEQAVLDLSRIEFFACFGDSPVDVRATWASRSVDTGTGPEPCPYTGGNVPCEASPGWLLNPIAVGLMTPEGQAVDASARASMERRVYEIPEVAFMTLTLAMDHAQAADCRVQDRRGRDVVPRDQAVAWCRLRFVINAVSWNEALILPEEEDVVRVLAAELPVHREFAGEPYGAAVTEGTELLVVAGPERDENGTPWYGVIPRTGIGWPWGWVPFMEDDRPTLVQTKLDCPKRGDWAGIVRLDVAARVSCFASRSRMTVTALVEPVPEGPTGGACRVYAELVDANRPCEAAPGWLARDSGFLAADPDDGSVAANISFDPRTVDPSSLPTAPTLMRLTGQFWHPEASDCEVVDPGTGDTLVWSPAAWRYCAGQFVVTSLEPVP